MVTFEEYEGMNENIHYYRVLQNGVHKANKIVPYEGYVISNINETETTDEYGNVYPKVYYRSKQAPITLDLSCFVAVPEEPGMDIAGNTDKEEVM